jgi:hypothetical protein
LKGLLALNYSLKVIFCYTRILASIRQTYKMTSVKRLLTFALGVTFTFVSFGSGAAAQNNQPGSGLSISPLHNQLTLDPGASSTLKINVKNITQNAVLAKAYVNDFTADNQSGNPVIVTDSNKQLPTSIKHFVSPSDVPLAIGEKKEITIPIKIPSDATPGAYYGIIRYRAIPSGANAPGNGAVSLSASVGTIVLIQVKGQLREQAQLSSLKVYNGDNSGTLFFQKPNKVGVEVSNLGNSFIQPFGKVVVTNNSGKQVYSYELNNVQPRANVLPGSKRVFKDSIKNISKPGRYKVTASITFGDGSNVLVSQKTFWYITGWMLAVIIAVLAVLVVLTLLAYRRYRKGRRHTKRRR